MRLRAAVAMARFAIPEAAGYGHAGMEHP